MSQPQASDYDVISFDCYGTLVDWESAIVSTLQELLQSHDANMNDDVVLEYFANWEPEEQIQGGTYRSVLRRVLDRYGFRLGFKPRSKDYDTFEECVARAGAFEDTIDALESLQKGFKLAVITNTDNDLFAITREALNVEFDFVVTAEDTGCYKPNTEMFNVAVAEIGKKDRLLHVAQSVFHDISPANSLGIDSVWIDRTSGRPGATKQVDEKAKWTYTNLQELVDQLLMNS
ncbi:MAG: HAD-IA family hydrolase [Gammaproteobacteria bacterium]|nr:HAD-IA family hydrolase [Gammaproteobacteria bacterium]MYD80333.1 HAD-IA family hydrolase [Gammaproteobacteria bacterium]